MRHTLTIERATPTPEFNEYEGYVEGRLDGHRVRAHVFLIGESWNDLRPGLVREVWAKVVRKGDVTIVDASSPAVLGGDAIVGTVRRRDGETAIVDSVIPIEVDLDLVDSPEVSIADVQVGDRISVHGDLEIDFDPDDYEDD